MARKTILALTPGHPGQMEALEKSFRVIRLWQERDPDATIRENARDIAVIVTDFAPVRAALLNALPNVKLIAVGIVGIEHIDMQAAAQKGIAVTNTPDVLTEDTADLGMALILALSRRVVEGDAFVRAGMWRSQSFPLSTGLAGKTLGIFGLGRIGQSVARKAAAFGMEIAYHSRRFRDGFEAYQYFPALEDLAGASDFLICCCPGGEDTRHAVDYNILGHLGPRGYLINIARGSVVKEDDLLAALSNKIIAGAALDVYENEPQVPEAFFVMDNVVLTPHIGSATRETRRKMGDLVVANIAAFDAGGPLVTPVRI